MVDLLNCCPYLVVGGDVFRCHKRDRCSGLQTGIGRLEILLKLCAGKRRRGLGGCSKVGCSSYWKLQIILSGVGARETRTCICPQGQVGISEKRIWLEFLMTLLIRPDDFSHHSLDERPMAASYQVALIVQKPNVDQFQFLVTRQRRPFPEKFDGLPYVDRELWDLPRALLSKADGRNAIRKSPSEDDDGSVNITCCVTDSLHKLGLSGFNVREAVSKVEAQLYPSGDQLKAWKCWRLVEEANYGPGQPLHTIIFITESEFDETQVPGGGHWLTSHETIDLLAQSGAREMRVGPLAAMVVSPHVPEGFVNGFTNSLGQDYPPGIVLVPMDSITGRPFTKTNLVIISPSKLLKKEITMSSQHAASGEVLIADPGCTKAAHSELKEIVKSLPKKMLVFVTHHHWDHIDGLPAVRYQNPDAVLIAHEATFRRMGKATQGFKCISVEGGAKLLVGGRELDVISAPGHTDGHLALYDSATGTLVAGDHCVGQGSSVLDPTSGGSLKDYLDSTRRLLDLEPHIVVSMHGRPNLWPAHMLNGYIKHREARELKILKAIEGGAKSPLDILSIVYADTPRAVWDWALANVMLHVEHLKLTQKLPGDFSIEDFQKDAKVPFTSSL